MTQNIFHGPLPIEKLN
uniref:Uncharacterized protein n=1 Tax=Rhizophora mucronata TaxID=61149 RepID=A0A2P2PA46_RHIMU